METDAGPTIVLQEFGSEEKYATAALFSLALHLTQVEAGAGREAVGTGLADIAWGQPAEDEADTDCDATADGDLDKAKSAAFWGWDCCGPGGLLERIFRALNIPERSWSGLKKLPEVGGLSPKQRDAYLRLVTQYMHVLDSALSARHLAPRRTSGSTSQHSQHSTPAQQAKQQPYSHTGYLPNADEMLLDTPTYAATKARSLFATDSTRALENAQPEPADALDHCRSAAAASSGDPHASSEQTGPHRLASAGAAGDPSLSAARDTDLLPDSPDSAEQRDTKDDWFDGLLSDSDSDLEADLSSMQLQRTGSAIKTQRSMPSTSRPEASPSRGTDDRANNSLNLHSPDSPASTHLTSAQFAQGRATDGSQRSPAVVDGCPTARSGVANGQAAAIRSPGHADAANEARRALPNKLAQALHSFYGDVDQSAENRNASGPGNEAGSCDCRAGQHADCAAEASTSPKAAQQPDGVEAGARPLSAFGSSVAAAATDGDSAGVATQAELMGAGPSQDLNSEIMSDLRLGSPAERAMGGPNRNSLAGTSGAMQSDEQGSLGGGSPGLPARMQATLSRPSQKAIMAMWELLDSCIAKPAPDAAAPKNGGREESRRRTTSADSEQVLGMHTPNVRFYDARARVTLKRMAAWLNVPWEKVAAFEHLQAYQLLVPEEGTDKKREMTVWEKSIWAAKIGGAAVGAGALFAVTGGLAAPAIAAGMGAAIGLVGGASAATAAAGATGFLATTAGTAVLASGIGAAGGGVAGSRMARRIGDVKEFGFWEVTDPADVEGLSPSASNAGSVFSEESNGTWYAGEGDAAAAESRTSDRSAGAGASSLGSLVSRQTQEHPVSMEQPTLGAGPPARTAATADIELVPMGKSAAAPVDIAEVHQQHDGTGAPAAGGGSQVGNSAAQQGAEPSFGPSPSEVDAGHITFESLSSAPRGRPGAQAALASRSAMTALPQQGMVSRQQAQHDQTTHTPFSNVQQHSTLAGSGSGTSAAPDAGSREAQHMLGHAAGARGSSASLKTDGSLSKRPSRGLSIATSGRTKSDAGSGPKSPSWWRRKKRKELPLLPVPVSPSRKPDDMHMSLTIGISGSIAQRDDFLTVWRGLPAAHSELFTLVWESPELLALNGAIADFLTKQAYQEVVKFTLQNFFYTGLVAAVAAPWALLSFSQLIDTAWAVVMDRAIKAGKLLAHVLMANAHGDRPVILIGYSMGARLVFHCLLELCRHNAKGIVEHAVMLGMPVSTRHERWVMARSVVAGRFVNGYSNSDWVLGLVYRGTNGFIKEAGGLCAVNCAGVENVNLTTIIDGHFGYQKKLSEILDLIDLYN